MYNVTKKCLRCTLDISNRCKRPWFCSLLWVLFNCLCMWRGCSFSVFVFVEPKVWVNVNLVGCNFSFIWFDFDRFVRKLYHRSKMNFFSFKNFEFTVILKWCYIIQNIQHSSIKSLAFVLSFLFISLPLHKKNLVRRIKCQIFWWINSKREGKKRVFA